MTRIVRARTGAGGASKTDDTGPTKPTRPLPPHSPPSPVPAERRDPVDEHIESLRDQPGTMSLFGELTAGSIERAPGLRVGGEDRRASKRFCVARQGKLFRSAAMEYAGATTVDISQGGMLLDVKSRRRVEVGEEVRVGVAGPGGSVVRERSMLPARVVRVSGGGDSSQRVAVCYAIGLERASLRAA